MPVMFYMYQLFLFCVLFNKRLNPAEKAVDTKTS
jgi:hypothetical protein